MSPSHDLHAVIAPSAEKRRHPRIPVDRPVKLVYPDNSIHITKLCDLSLEGLALLEAPVVKGNRVAVHLRLPQIDEAAHQEIVLECRVVHRSTKPGADFHKVGVCIDKITSSAFMSLKQYLSYKLNYYLW